MTVPTAFDAHGECDDPGPAAQLALEVVEVERAVALVDLDHAHDEVEVARQLEPGRDVAVVVELRHDDLVAGAQLPPERPGEREVERRHVRAEADLRR